MALQLLASMTNPDIVGKETAMEACGIITEDTTMVVSILRNLSEHPLKTWEVLARLAPHFDSCMEQIIRPIVLNLLKDPTNSKQHQCFAIQCLDPRQEDFSLLYAIASLARDTHEGLYEEAVEQIDRLYELQDNC